MRPVVALIAILGLSANAQEHPEHPMGNASSQAPAQSEKPMSMAELREHYSQVVQDKVRQESEKTDHLFVVHDDKLAKDWKMSLVRIHKEKIVKLAPDLFFACSDFKSAGEDKSLVDLDFYVRKKGDDWNVEQVLVHKVNGKPRYHYDKNNNRVAVKD